MNPTSNVHIQQGILLVTSAIQADNALDYTKALPLYKKSLHHFMIGLKHENNPTRKHMIENKVNGYMERAEQLQQRVTTNNLQNPPAESSDVAPYFENVNAGLFYVAKAVEKDNAGEYSKAIQLYKTGIQYLLTSLNSDAALTLSAGVKRQQQDRISSYLNRCEQLQELIHEPMCIAAPTNRCICTGKECTTAATTKANDTNSTPPSKEGDTDAGLCQICMDSPVYVDGTHFTVTPCGHTFACEPCLNHLKQRGLTCSICRGPIATILKVHETVIRPAPPPAQSIRTPSHNLVLSAKDMGLNVSKKQARIALDTHDTTAEAGRWLLQQSMGTAIYKHK